MYIILTVKYMRELQKVSAPFPQTFFIYLIGHCKSAISQHSPSAS